MNKLYDINFAQLKNDDIIYFKYHDKDYIGQLDNMEGCWYIHHYGHNPIRWYLMPIEYVKSIELVFNDSLLNRSNLSI